MSSFVVSQLTPFYAGNVGGGGCSGSSSSGNVNVFVSPTVSNDCNCEELCKPVHAVFLELAGYSASTQAKVPVVYLTGLTQQQVQHVEDMWVWSCSQCGDGGGRGGGKRMP